MSKTREMSLLIIGDGTYDEDGVSVVRWVLQGQVGQRHLRVPLATDRLSAPSMALGNLMVLKDPNSGRRDLRLIAKALRRELEAPRGEAAARRSARILSGDDDSGAITELAELCDLLASARERLAPRRGVEARDTREALAALVDWIDRGTAEGLTASKGGRP